MRLRSRRQMEFNLFGMPVGTDEKSLRMAEMDKLVEAHPEWLDAVIRDVGISENTETGRPGMTFESILRCGILKQFFNESYDDLVHFLGTHSCSIMFARLPAGYVPGRSTLQENIGAIKPETWEQIFRDIVNHAYKANVDDGSVARVDSTVTEALMHDPTDNSLLADSIRVMDRLMAKASELPKSSISWEAGKVRKLGQKYSRQIQYAKGDDFREELYQKLLDLTGDTVRRLEYALKVMPLASEKTIIWMMEVKHYLPLIAKVMDQCKRRVFDKEKVPAGEKIVSIFEPHANIIVKSKAGPQYGHKINLVTGKSGIILDISIETGNPADSERFLPMLERHMEHYGRPPRQFAADGGYASRSNLEGAKSVGVEDMAFHKKCGLKVEEMTSSKRVYRKLRDFRAGIESNISCLKRVYGWGRCTWRGLEHFQAYVWSAAVAYNLNILAKLALE